MTFTKLTLAVLAAALTASAASAQVANGRYQLGACTTHPLETVVRLQNNVLTFYESICTLSNPTPIQGTQGYSYAANCAGEGQQWQSNMMLIPLEGGQVMRMLRDGHSFDYTRCTP
jgi:hypothetical protein